MKVLTIVRLLRILRNHQTLSAYSLYRLSGLSHIGVVSKYLVFMQEYGLIEYDHVRLWYGRYPQARYYKVSQKGRDLLSIFDRVPLDEVKDPLH